MVSSRNTRHLWSLEHRLRKRLWIFAHHCNTRTIVQVVGWFFALIRYGNYCFINHVNTI